MKFNFGVRFRNKAFWVAFIPAVLFVVESILSVFGIAADFSVLSDKLICVVKATFSLLVLLGVAIDPTTEGISDSELAMTYKVPKKDE